MAIIIDEKAREAVARRRARGRDHTLYLRVERTPRSWGAAGGMSNLIISWVPRRLPDHGLVVRPMAEAVVIVDRRVARYATWHNVTISAWRLGPFDQLMVDPNVLLDVQAWEPTHPATEPRSA